LGGATAAHYWAVAQATMGYGIFVFKYATHLNTKTLPLRILPRISSYALLGIN
jgi:hypothetical protein